MIKQKDAVFAAFQSAEQQGITGEAARTFAVEQVKQGLMAGEIAHSKGQLDEKAAQTYAGSLVGNWLKKDERLNGGAKYVPTTKRGPQVKDETLKKLNEALKSLKVRDPENMTLITQVEERISARKAELAAEKAGSKVASLEDTMAALADLGITAE